MFRYSMAAGICLFTSIALAQPKGDRPKEGTLKVGDAAPDFKLKKMEAKGEVQLSSFRDKKPVVLVFGSYT